MSFRINGLLIFQFNLQAGETECTLGCRGNFFLIDTDGSDLWSQGRLNAAVSAFLLIMWYVTFRFPFPFFCFFVFCFCFFFFVFSNYRKRQKITKRCSNQDVWLDVALARLSPFWTKIQKIIRGNEGGGGASRPVLDKCRSASLLDDGRSCFV